MQRSKLSVFVVAIVPFVGLSAARAQAPEAPDPYGQPTGPQVTQVDPSQPAAPPEENPIPPNVEGQAVPSQGGGYCYGGPHPAPGGGWEATTSPHMHDYAPFDLRLFSFHDGCYYFIGDPKDFGYTGEAYSYYGAHPILDSYGGGWCFMIGAHSHWWRPWSPYFTVVGPWYYWNGPYDPFFWSYWPYYSFYYRSYYPSYYAGGRFYRTWRAAPPIRHVPPTGWRGNAATGGWRGSPPGGVSRNGAVPGGVGGWRGAPAAGAPYHAAPSAGGWHGSPATGGGWHGSPGTGAWRSSPVPNSSPLRSVPYGGGTGGGWHAPSGGWHAPAPSGGGWHATPGGSFHAPSGGGWHGSPGGGWHGGGGFRGGRR
jgi:hypothetical protein